VAELTAPVAVPPADFTSAGGFASGAFVPRAARSIAVVLLALVAACGRETGPDHTPTRTYRLGFSAVPPRPEQAALVQGLELWTRRSDIAIVHEELPWTALLAGTPPDTILRREKDDLMAYYRGKGLALVFVADGTDGLAREKDPPQLRAAGRSITEPAIQALYCDYVLAFVRRFRPDYVGLASETNLTRAIGAPPLYQALVTMANAAAGQIRAEPDAPPLFVSVQVEVAWGRLAGGGQFAGVAADRADFQFVDLLGLSSYPYFVWDAPEALPDDYYARLVADAPIPVMVVEGGWASASGGAPGFSPAEQARYLTRQAALLDRAGGLALIQLTFTDLDLTAFPPDVRAPLEPFARLGVVDAAFLPKPALAVWDSLYAVRRR
jgi:hypothetical protein